MNDSSDPKRLIRQLRPWLHRRVSTVSTFLSFEERRFQAVGSGFFFWVGDLPVFVTCAHVLGPAFRAVSISADFEVRLIDGRNNGKFFKPLAMVRFKPGNPRELPHEAYGGRDIGILVLNKRDVSEIATSRKFLSMDDISEAPLKVETICAFRGYPSGLYEWNGARQSARGWYEVTMVKPDRRLGLKVKSSASAQLWHGLDKGLSGVSGCPVFEASGRKLVGLIARGHTPAEVHKSVDLLAHDSCIVVGSIKRLAACYQGTSDSDVEQVRWE